MASKAQTIFEGLVNRGFTPSQAAALAGHIKVESGFNPTAWNQGEGAGGLLQWRLDRLTGLEKYAKDTNRNLSDPEMQLDYIVEEMKSNEAANAASFLAAQDVPSASKALKRYIRFANGTENERLSSAMAFAGKPNQDKAGMLADWGAGSGAAAPGKSKKDLLEEWGTPVAPAKSDRSDFLAAWGAQPEGPPPGAKPGSKEYADWAVNQAKAGKVLPQVSGTPPEPQFTGPNQDIGSKLYTAGGSFLEGMPVVGPTLIDWAKQGRSALYGTTKEQEDQMFAEAKAANPLTATAGSVTGAVLPLAALGTTQLGGNLLGVTGPTAQRIGTGLASGGVISAADTLARGGTTEDAIHNALLGGMVGAALPAGGAVLKSAWQGLKGPGAAKALSTALDAEGIAPSQVNQLLAERGPRAVVADLGPNLQNLAGGLAAVPGKAQTIVKNALIDRAGQAGQRLATDIEQNLGTGAGLQAATANLIQMQRANAKPIYDAVGSVALPVTGDLAAVIRTPMGEKAFRDAAVTLANDGVQVNGLTVGLLDAAKQSLDDVASSAARQGNNNLARQAAGMAKKLREAADAVEPRYAQAREAFAGPAGVLDAIEDGKSVFTKAMSPDDLKSTMAGMTASEREGLLLGAQSYIQELIGNAKNDARAIRDAFKSNFAKDKLALLVGDEAANNIMKAIEREAAFADTSHVAAGNSLTAAT